MIDIINADCRTAMPEYAPFDMLIADPPYGGTSFVWDKRCAGWIEAAATLLKPTGSMWVFGSMRLFQEIGAEFKANGWKYAQDIVWEKHNGSGFQSDRFKRVHEHVVQYYRFDTKWGSIYNDVQTFPGPKLTVVRRKKEKLHLGKIESSSKYYEDGDQRIMRSVIFMRSMQRRAIHPTEKPSELMEILIRTSCPLEGLVGDMFAGSGSAGEAAVRADRAYLGCEIDSDMALKARNRLSQLLLSSTVKKETSIEERRSC